MSKLTEKAWELRLPIQSSEENLESCWSTVIRYGNRILVSGRIHNPRGNSWIAAVYEFVHDDETSCEDMVGIHAISDDRYEDAGHAIAWCLKQE